jgi:hypothetical protein
MTPLWKGKNPIYFGVITIIPFDNLFRWAYFVMHTFRVTLEYTLGIYIFNGNLIWAFHGPLLDFFLLNRNSIVAVTAGQSYSIGPYEKTNK